MELREVRPAVEVKRNFELEARTVRELEPKKFWRLHTERRKEEHRSITRASFKLWRFR